jgi:hypothetical protein
VPQNTYFFTFFPLYISYGLQLVHSENNNKSKSPFIFFKNCISAQVIHYSLKPCLCNLTSEMLAIKACTCNNDKEKPFSILLNKMCMNLKNSHPFTESAEGIFCAQLPPPWCPLGAGPPPHSTVPFTGCFEGPCDLRCGANFCCKNVGGFVSQIRQEKST